MSVKLALPILSLLGIGGASYYSISPSLNPLSLDYSFYNDPDLFNKLDPNSYIYKTDIQSDNIGAREYLLNNSLSLMYRKPGDASDIKYGNAFILNALYPDWMAPASYERDFYSPKFYRGSDEITLLLGTSLSFASKLFDKVGDSSTDINNSTDCKTLQSLSNSSNSHNLYLSHPYPVVGSKNYLSLDTKPIQDFLYRWEENDSIYNSYDFGLKKSHYTKLDSSKVCLMYAAVDLSVNKNLVDISTSSSRNLSNYLEAVHDDSNLSYTDSIRNIYGKEYKLAVDFAVIQVKLGANNFKSQYLRYLSDMYKKAVVLPKVFRGELGIYSGKTQPLYMGGWETMSEFESDMHTMSNLFVDAKIENKDKKHPSDINASDVQIKLYDKFSLKNAQNPTESSDYEVVDKDLSPNNEDGVLYVSYRVKNKNKGWQLSEKQQLLFSGFKSNSNTNAGMSDALISWDNDFKSKNSALRDFLESKPRVSAQWKELEIDYSYFTYKSINDLMFDRGSLIDFKDTTDLSMDHSLNTFKVWGKEYLNIGHHVLVPNLTAKGYKGTPVLIEDRSPTPNGKSQKALFGMYSGTSNWKNPLGKIKHVGEIMMFISPWSYDLFNKNNKLSKPSLADSLAKKQINKQNLEDYLVHINRWVQKSSN